MPYMYCARRPITMPAITFSLMASSMNPSGAMSRHLAGAHVVGADHALDAAEMIDVTVGHDDGDQRSFAEDRG